MSLESYQHDFRDWLMERSPPRLGGHATAGLEVYLNNYRGQLLACLTESFATTRAWLGDSLFDSAASVHIDRHAPHAWTLDAYGIEFPQTLDALYPDDPEVGDLAGLERELGLSFVGSDAPALELSRLHRIDWTRAVFELVPTFSWLCVTTNAAAIWSAIESGTAPPAALRLAEPAHVAIWRSGFSPRLRTLEPLEARVLLMLAKGSEFGQLCAAVVTEAGEEQGPAVAGNLLARWIGDGIICDVRVGSESPPRVDRVNSTLGARTDQRSAPCNIRGVASVSIL